MWRLDRLPSDRLAASYGVRFSPRDLETLRHAPVRILAAGSGGTGTFASANGLILTNHHVALDCIRTSTLADDSENYVERGFTAPVLTEELPCKRFLVQVEREAHDVTDRLSAAAPAGAGAEEVQQARERVRSDLERSCENEKGGDFRCEAVDFGSGARSYLIVYEQYKDVRLVYAPEVSLGYFGGDEMNFRFPRYVSDFSILRAYVARDGAHREYHEENVPAKPSHYLRVGLDGVGEGDFTWISGFPGNTNRYRMSFSADYNVRKGMPDSIRNLEAELELLEKYAAMKPAYDLLLKSRIFGLANALKYQRDVHQALVAAEVVSSWRRRERELMDFLETRPELKAEYGSVLEAQAKVYAEDVEAFDPLDSALEWLQKSTVLGYASGLYEFAIARAKSSDAEREPQFQERRWPEVREELLNDDPVLLELDEDLLTRGFELALVLEGAQRIAAVESLAERVGRDPRKLARAVLEGTEVDSLDRRKQWVEAPLDVLEESKDPAMAFARELEPALEATRKRVRVLNEKIFMNRAKFSRALSAWKHEELYFDANFTLRGTFGQVRGLVDREGREVPFTTRLDGLFRLAKEKGDQGDYALPAALRRWRESVGEEKFEKEYGSLPVNFVTTNDTTGGNSGSAVLDRSLRIVGLLFDGNEGSMASDWSYNEKTGRSIATDIRFALFVAREVHGAGWIVDELMK
jgi:hypothetical protein